MILIPEDPDDEARIKRATPALRELLGPFRVTNHQLQEHPTLGRTVGELFDQLRSRIRAATQPRR